MLRETKGLVARRKDEGCIAVEMELAGVQAVCFLDFSFIISSKQVMSLQKAAMRPKD